MVSTYNNVDNYDRIQCNIEIYDFIEIHIDNGKLFMIMFRMIQLRKLG